MYLKIQYDECVQQCTHPFIEDEATGNCVINCPKGTFALDGTCINCPEGCGECSDSKTCTRCSKGAICELTCSGDNYIHDIDGERKMCVNACDAPNSYISTIFKAGYKVPYCEYCGESCADCA